MNNVGQVTGFFGSQTTWPSSTRRESAWSNCRSSASTTCPGHQRRRRRGRQRADRSKRRHQCVPLRAGHRHDAARRALSRIPKAYSSASAISNAGIIVGSQQFARRGLACGRVQRPGGARPGCAGPPLGRQLRLCGERSAGQIVGQSGLFSPTRAFDLQPATGMVGLPESSWASAINSAGQVTGWWTDMPSVQRKHGHRRSRRLGRRRHGSGRHQRCRAHRGPCDDQLPVKDCAEQRAFFYSPEAGMLDWTRCSTRPATIGT